MDANPTPRQPRLPNILAKDRDHISASFVSKNRFAALDYDSCNEVNLSNRSKVFQNHEKARQKFQLRTTALGNYGGAKSCSENDVALLRDDEHIQNHRITKQVIQPKGQFLETMKKTRCFPQGMVQQLPEKMRTPMRT